MDYSKRNKKAAIARWKNILEKENTFIAKTSNKFAIKAAISGFLTGDGSVQIRKEKTFHHYQVDFFPDDEVMLSTYLKFMKEIYNKKPTVKKLKNFSSARISSRTIVFDLMKYNEYGLISWTLPTTLLCNKRAKVYWLKAFFSAEAYVGPRSIKIQTVNEQGMKDAKEMLTELGIESKMYSYEPKKETHSKVFMIFINKKEARIAFYNKVGFWHSKKTKKLKESLDL